MSNHLNNPTKLTALSVSPRNDPADLAVNVTAQVAAKAKAKAEKNLAILYEQLLNGNISQEYYDKFEEQTKALRGKGGSNRKRSKKYKNQKRTRSRRRFRRRFRRGSRRRSRH